MTDGIKDGGAAFPQHIAITPSGDVYDGTSGMSLHDYFAGQALAGLLAGGFADTVPHDDVGGGDQAAGFAYQYADAMLAERNKAREGK